MSTLQVKSNACAHIYSTTTTKHNDTFITILLSFTFFQPNKSDRIYAAAQEAAFFSKNDFMFSNSRASS